MALPLALFPASTTLVEEAIVGCLVGLILVTVWVQDDLAVLEVPAVEEELSEAPL